MLKGGSVRKSPDSYRLRTYRDLADDKDLVSSFFRLKETDLHILAEKDVTREAGELATKYRLQVERYIESRPEFAKALIPLAEDQLAPPIISKMLHAGMIAGVGPMAAVAGGIAEYVGRGLVEAGHKEVIVENGGDLFVQRSVELTISVYAGQSPLSNRLGMRLEPEQMPLGICTSSGTVGHSLSFGEADSVTVLADSAFIADATATRLGNEVGTSDNAKESIAKALAVAGKIELIRGVLVICGETMGAVGDIELKPLS